MRQYYIIFLMIIVSGEDLVHSCVRSLNAACELVSGNSRECRVTCNTLEKIGKLKIKQTTNVQCNTDKNLLKNSIFFCCRKCGYTAKQNATS